MYAKGDAMTKKEDMLVPLDSYLSTGIHIGMKQRIKQMARYIYKVRPDKLAVFDIAKIDARIRVAVKFLSPYKPEEIIVVSRKRNGHKPVVKFAEVTGAKAVYGRFHPGTLTNPKYQKYTEPKVMIVTDPFADRQAVIEAFKANIPIIALCDTYNDPKYVDIVVPLNNKGRKSVALFYWLLARELLKSWRKISRDEDFKHTVGEFEMPAEAEAAEGEEEAGGAVVEAEPAA